MAKILKAELIELLKAGETLVCLHGWNKPDSFYMRGSLRNVHRASAMSLIEGKQAKLIGHDRASADYVWAIPKTED